MNSKTGLLALFTLAVSVSPSPADIKLPQVFGNHMVLQRGMKTPIYGKAAPGESVKVSFRDQEKTAKADTKGNWRVLLDPLKAGGPDELTLAGLPFEILPVPGHSPDSLVFHVALFQKLFGGDTLFAGSIGRTDLPGGDHQLLLDGIRDKIFPLPSETEILPGHGSSTSIGQESAKNPYLA